MQRCKYHTTQYVSRKAYLMFFVRQELDIDPVGVEISLVLYPIPFMLLYWWRVGTAGGFARSWVRFSVIC